MGVDPGSTVTGFGIIEVVDRALLPLDYGCIRPPAKLPLSVRRKIIFEGLTHLIEEHQPTVLVVETQFVHKNVKGAITLGMVRGIAILAATLAGVPAYEYSPTKAKKATCGIGSASKHQMQAMVQRLLNLKDPPPPHDAADALALAICHVQNASCHPLPEPV